MSSVNQALPLLNTAVEEPRYLVHRVRLKPNNVQATYFRQACGIKRLAYNWAKAESAALYTQGVFASKYDLCKRFTALKDQKFPFVRDVSKWVPQKAIYDFDDALQRFFKGRKGTGPKCGFPKFKKKGKSRDSFYVGPVNVSDRYVHVPNLGKVKARQKLRFPGKILSVTISREANYWFAAVLVKVDETWVYPHRCKNQATVGVDLGLKGLAFLSDGSHIENPKWFRAHQKKLRRLSRQLARRCKGSNRREKARRALVKEHYRIACLRHNTLHTFTANLVTKFKHIGIEDLNVAGMLKNKRLAASLADASFGEIRRQIEYKAKLAGATVVVANRWFASTQICSHCGQQRRHPLSLSDRSWVCPNCQTQHDRDLNAAKNLRNVVLRFRKTQNARGAQGSGRRPRSSVKPSAKKRESSSC